MITLMGVWISWLVLARNSDLICEASSAFSIRIRSFSRLKDVRSSGPLSARTAGAFPASRPKMQVLAASRRRRVPAGQNIELVELPGEDLALRMDFETDQGVPRSSH